MTKIRISRHHLVAAVLAGCCLGSAQAIVIAPDPYSGMAVGGYARECIGGTCPTSGPVEQQDGGVGAGSASIAMPPPKPPGVDFSGSAQVSGVSLLPQLSAFASANTPVHYTTYVLARGIQQYVDTDGGSTMLQLVLTGSRTGNGAVTGFVNVYDNADYDPNSTVSHGTLLANALVQIGGETTSSLSFSRAAGQGFYVAAGLVASASSQNQPSIADGGNTLTLSFVGPSSGLVPVGVVPEPAHWALLLCGLGVVARRVSRQRGAADAAPPAPPLRT